MKTIDLAYCKGSIYNVLLVNGKIARYDHTFQTGSTLCHSRIFKTRMGKSKVHNCGHQMLSTVKEKIVSGKHGLPHNGQPRSIAGRFLPVVLPRLQHSRVGPGLQWSLIGSSTDQIPGFLKPYSSSRPKNPKQILEKARQRGYDTRLIFSQQPES